MTPKAVVRPTVQIEQVKQRTLPNHLQATKFVEMANGGRIHHVKADHNTKANCNQNQSKSNRYAIENGIKNKTSDFASTTPAPADG